MPNELGLAERSIIVIVSLQLQDIHDLTGQTRVDVDVAAYWREDNDNPALRRFFELIQELYPASSGN